MDAAPDTDAIIIGAGPAGLFAAFQLGLFGFQSAMIDTLAGAGGQCRALYADKPVFDVPGFPRIDAGEFVERLLIQVEPFTPVFLFNRKAVSIRRDGSRGLTVTTSGDEELRSKVVIIAAGGGAFRAGVAAPNNLALDAMPFQSWSLPAVDGAIPVDSATFLTGVPGIFAIGDACDYPGKVRLIVSGCHEAALMAQAVRKMLRPGGRAPLYASTSPTLRRRLGVEE